MPICTKCNINKPIMDFHINNAVKSGYHSRCKLCRCTDQKIYKSTRREYYTYREWLKNLKRHGITENEWHILYNKQQGKCAICLEISNKKLHVDHCHSTGRIRGLLCGACNMGIGQLKDNPNILRQAIKYLED